MPDGDSLKSQMGLDVADMLKSLGDVTSGFSKYNLYLRAVNASMKQFNSLASSMITNVNALAKAWNAVAAAAGRASTALAKAHSANTGISGIAQPTVTGSGGSGRGGKTSIPPMVVTGNLLGIPTDTILNQSFNQQLHETTGVLAQVNPGLQQYHAIMASLQVQQQHAITNLAKYNAGISGQLGLLNAQKALLVANYRLQQTQNQFRQAGVVQQMAGANVTPAQSLVLQTRLSMLQQQAANGSLRHQAALGKINNQMLIYNKSLGSSNQQTGEANKQLNIMHLSWTSIARLVTVQLIRRAVSALLGAIRQSITEAKDLMIRISELQTIDPKEFPFHGWITGLRELSDAWGLDILDQAKGTYETLSNQIAFGADALIFLGKANQFAVTTITSVNDAVQSGTGLMNAYGLAGTNANEIYSKLFKTIELGRIRGQELTDIGPVSVLAHQTKISIDELLAAFQVLTIQGIKPTRALTELRNIITKILKPTSDMKDFFREINVETGEMAIKTYGLAGFFSLLRDKTAGSSTELVKYMNSIRGISGAMIFTGKDLELLIENTEKTANAFETYGERTKRVMDNLGKQFDIELNRIRNFFIEDFGVSLITKFSAVFGGFQSLSDAVKIFSQSIIDLLLPAITLLVVKLGEVFLAANASTQIIIGIGVVLSTIRGFFTAAEARSDRNLAEIKKTWNAKIDITTRGLIREKNIIEKAADDQLKFDLKMIAKKIEVQNTALDLGIDHLKKTTNIFKMSQDDIVKNFHDYVRNIESEINRLKKSIENTPNEIEEMRRETDKVVFHINIEGKDPSQQVRDIQKRIQTLMIQAREAITSQDKKSLNEIYQEVISLTKQMQDISEKNGLGLERIGQRLIAITEEFIQMRLQIVEGEKDSLKNMETSFMKARLLVMEVDDLNKKITDFNIEDILKLDGIEAKQEAMDKIFKSIQKMIDIQKKYGLDTSYLEGRQKDIGDVFNQALAKKANEDSMKAIADREEAAKAAREEERALSDKTRENLKEIADMFLNLGQKMPLLAGITPTQMGVAGRPEIVNTVKGLNKELLETGTDIYRFIESKDATLLPALQKRINNALAMIQMADNIIATKYPWLKGEQLGEIRTWRIPWIDVKIPQLFDMADWLYSLTSFHTGSDTAFKPIIEAIAELTKRLKELEGTIDVNTKETGESNKLLNEMKRHSGDTTVPAPFIPQTRAPSKDISFMDYRNQPQLAGISIVINESGTPQQTAYAVVNEIVRMAKQGTTPLAIGRA